MVNKDKVFNKTAGLLLLLIISGAAVLRGYEHFIPVFVIMSIKAIHFGFHYARFFGAFGVKRMGRESDLYILNK